MNEIIIAWVVISVGMLVHAHLVEISTEEKYNWFKEYHLPARWLIFIFGPISLLVMFITLLIRTLIDAFKE